MVTMPVTGLWDMTPCSLALYTSILDEHATRSAVWKSKITRTLNTEMRSFSVAWLRQLIAGAEARVQFQASPHVTCGVAGTDFYFEHFDFSLSVLLICHKCYYNVRRLQWF